MTMTLTTTTLPMPLQEWAKAHSPNADWLKDSYWSQIIFIRDAILSIFAQTYEGFLKLQNETLVISTHHSKSVLLPVYQITLSDGTTFILRYNFYDWVVSVVAPGNVSADFMGLFDPRSERSRTSCDGFPTEKIFGSYLGNARQFTFSLSDNNELYTFCWIYAHQVLGNRNKKGLGR